MKPLFIHIPKNAGSSIAVALTEKNMFYKWMSGHHTQSQLESRASLHGYNYDYEFCVVRNPYEKMISAFFHIKRRMLKELKHFDQDYHDICLHVLGLNFNEFVEYFLLEVDTNDMLINYHHFLPQVTFLDSPKPIECFKMEDLNLIEKKLNITIPRLNLGNHGVTDYKSYYDTNTKNLVKTYYKMDFDRFEFLA
jgi:hypothetical protein